MSSWDGWLCVLTYASSRDSRFQGDVDSSGVPAFHSPGTTLSSQEILMNTYDLGWTDL